MMETLKDPFHFIQFYIMPKELTIKKLDVISTQKIIPFDPYVERLQDWQDEGKRLEQAIYEYEWKYRKRICSKCSETQKKQRGCVISITGEKKDGMDKTYCNWLHKAKSQNFRKETNNFLRFHPSDNSINNGIKTN